LSLKRWSATPPTLNNVEHFNEIRIMSIVVAIYNMISWCKRKYNVEVTDVCKKKGNWIEFLLRWEVVVTGSGGWNGDVSCLVSEEAKVLSMKGGGLGHGFMCVCLGGCRYGSWGKWGLMGTRSDRGEAISKHKTLEVHVV